MEVELGRCSGFVNYIGRTSPGMLARPSRTCNSPPNLTGGSRWSAERSQVSGRPLEPDPVDTGVGISDPCRHRAAFRIRNSSPYRRVDPASPPDLRRRRRVRRVGLLAGRRAVDLPAGTKRRRQDHAAAPDRRAGRPEPPTEVTAEDGRPLAGRVAYMAQQDLLLPWLGALDNVLVGCRGFAARRSAQLQQAARGNCSTRSGWATACGPDRPSFPAGCGSAWRWRAR